MEQRAADAFEHAPHRQREDGTGKSRTDDKERHDGADDDERDRRPGDDILTDEPQVTLAIGADLCDHQVEEGRRSAKGHPMDEPEVDEHGSLGDDAVVHEASGPDGTPGARVGQRRLARRAATFLAVLVYSWWAVALPPFSGLATGAVLVAGLGAVITGSTKRRPALRQASLSGAAPWLVLALVASAWELQAYLQQPRHDHPTLSSLANALLDSHPARAAAFVLWLLTTVELARR
jgi:hypothetical protein